VRWFLGGGRRTKSDLEDPEQSSSKRRRVDGGAATIGATAEDEPMDGTATPRPSLDPHDPRRLSIASTVDTLPAYDEYRSPAYTENAAEARPTSAAWQSRLIMSTSGLSIAMSEESLRSLKYCLSWLRWANVHIGNVIDKLKAMMDRFERSPSDMAHETAMATAAGPSDDRQQLVDNIAALRVDVLKTLQNVISTVSKYAGGALPENARILVRRHLTSLPHRFMVANMVGDGQQRSQSGQANDLSAAEAGAASEREAREGAQRVLVLATEGLDMMSQVSGVLDGTIVSAEDWCERLGRKRREQRESLVIGAELPVTYDGDKMETS
jgi:transcriptional repressor OPI1